MNMIITLSNTEVKQLQFLAKISINSGGINNNNVIMNVIDNGLTFSGDDKHEANYSFKVFRSENLPCPKPFKIDAENLSSIIKNFNLKAVVNLNILGDENAFNLTFSNDGNKYELNCISYAPEETTIKDNYQLFSLTLAGEEFSNMFKQVASFTDANDFRKYLTGIVFCKNLRDSSKFIVAGTDGHQIMLGNYNFLDLQVSDKFDKMSCIRKKQTDNIWQFLNISKENFTAKLQLFNVDPYTPDNGIDNNYIITTDNFLTIRGKTIDSHRIDFDKCSNWAGKSLIRTIKLKANGIKAFLDAIKPLKGTASDRNFLLFNPGNTANNITLDFGKMQQSGVNKNLTFIKKILEVESDILENGFLINENYFFKFNLHFFINLLEQFKHIEDAIDLRFYSSDSTPNNCEVRIWQNNKPQEWLVMGGKHT